MAHVTQRQTCPQGIFAVLTDLSMHTEQTLSPSTAVGSLGKATGIMTAGFVLVFVVFVVVFVLVVVVFVVVLLSVVFVVEIVIVVVVCSNSSVLCFFSFFSQSSAHFVSSV